MNDFAVLHISKYKQLGPIGKHIDREYVSTNVDRKKSGFNEELTLTLGSYIDHSKTHLKEELAAYAHDSLPRAVERRIEQGYTKHKAIRKDAVKALGIILTGSHERMKQIEADQTLFTAWKKRNYEFCCREFGKDNIVRFTLHRDEKTPHFHCVVVPITKEGGLAARQFIGTPAKLRAYQDRYAKEMATFGLARGIPKEITHRTHITTKQYYRKVNALAQKAEQITKDIHLKNVLQLNSVRKKTTEYVAQLQVQLADKELQYQYAAKTNQELIKRHQNVALQRRFDQEAKRAFSYIKQDIHLIDFVTTRLGWRLDKAKSSKRDAVLKHPKHGKIIAPTSPKQRTGQWVFSWIDRKGGGTLIDLLLEDGWDWKEIKALAASSNNIPIAEVVPHQHIDPPKKCLQEPQDIEKIALSKFQSIKNTSGATYLNHRGITPEVYAPFKQINTNKTQAVFALYKDFDRKGQANLCSTINYYLDREGNTRKYFQKDLPRGMALLQGNEPASTIVVTESPIDALSYRQLRLSEAIKAADQNAIKVVDSTMYLATCGSLSAGILKDLKQIFDLAHQKGQEIVLALDNDAAGRKMTQQIAHILERKPHRYHIATPPQGKDWNEFLTQHQRAEETKHVQQKHCLLQKALDTPKSVAYEKSLLHRIGIHKKVYDELQDCQLGAHTYTVGLYKNLASKKQRCGTYTVALNKQGLVTRRYEQELDQGIAVLQTKEPVRNIVLTEGPLEALIHRQKLWQELNKVRKEYFDASKQEHVRLEACQGSSNEENRQHWSDTCQRTLAIKAEVDKLSQQFNQTMYVSTCGSQTRHLQKELIQLLKQAQENQQQVTLQLKESSIKALEDLLKENVCHYTIQQPPMLTISKTLDQVAETIKTLSRDHAWSVDQDEEEGQKQRKKGRGRRLHL